MAVHQDFRLRHAYIAFATYSAGDSAGAQEISRSISCRCSDQYGQGLPPVVVGLFVSIFLWRSRPLGFLEL
ncbi:MAG TPA: hypothetical protein VE689_10735, partial [Candidatus Udaeobacter sp.]|nr:hypothetical protein [Candidatus Udaeobacter sp.]